MMQYMENKGFYYTDIKDFWNAHIFWFLVASGPRDSVSEISQFFEEHRKEKCRN